MGQGRGCGKSEALVVIQERKCKGRRKQLLGFMPEWQYSKNKEVLREFGLEGKLQLQTVSFDWSFGGRGTQQAVRAKENLSARDVTVGAMHIG